MKKVGPLRSRRVAQASRPRNPVLAAMKARRSRGAGAHVKSRGALRRTERMTLARLAREAS